MSLVMRWLHVGGAAVAVGGLVFLVMVILPAMRRADPEQAVLLMRDVLRRARVVLWTSLVAVLVSGIYAAGAGGPAPGAAYRVVFPAKVILSVLFLLVAGGALLPASTPEGQRRRTDWMRLGLWLGIGVILLSGWLRQLRLPA